MRWFVTQPFIVLVLAYCAGISAGHGDCIQVEILYAAAASLLIGLLSTLFFKSYSAAAACVFGLFFCIGFYSLYQKIHPDPAGNSILRYVDQGSRTIEAVIAEPPGETLHRTKLQLAVRSIHDRDRSVAATGNLLLGIKDWSRRFSYGDRIRFSSALHTPRNFSNPGGFDYKRHLAYKNIYATAFLESDASITLVRKGEGARWLVFIESLRNKIRASITNSTQPPSRDILLALIIGEQGTIPEQIRNLFSALGITHILSISGLHVSIFALLAYAIIFNLLKLYPRLLLYIPAKKIAVCTSIFPVLGYCMIAGMATPAARSGLMVVCYLLTLLLDRPQHMLHTLFVAAFFILAVTPQSLFEISFQLSFLAVFFLIILVPAWKSLGNKKKSGPLGTLSPLRAKLTAYTADSLRASAAAMLGTAPIVACYFHTFAPSGFITNLVMVPLAGFLLVPLGLAAAMMVFIWQPGAVLIFKTAALFTDFFLILAKTFYSALGDALTTSTPLFWEVVFFYGLLILSAVCRTRKQWLLYGCGLLAFIGAEFSQAWYANRPVDSLSVTFLDVGAGDAAVIQLPNKEVLIIDGGGLMDDSFDMGKAVIAPYLYSQGIKKVDYIVVTHPHRDHVGGLPYIAGRFAMRELWHNGAHSLLAPYQALMKTAALNKIPIIACTGATKMRTIGTVTFEFFNPSGEISSGYDEDQNATNNNSLVLRISYGNVSFLFAADILHEREAELIEAGTDLSATVLKVPHHGGQSSCSEVFLRAVQASVAVVSGRSSRKRKTPHPAVKQRLEQLDIDTYVTEQSGAITIKTDGETFHIHQYKSISSI
ncbi:MAG: DNA internalization-related competence protein ComEC/Rec2 [Deltaproteobacteria bacterium]|nr:DNA internalization-related competence protein ComEC/Rec2 [Deltaproteobacteria bacterium]